MFNWAKKLLSSLDIAKQEKTLRKKHSVEVPKLISKRLFDINSNTGSYAGGKVSIDDRPFTADERNARKYDKLRAEQVKDKEPVMVELPSTAIASARFDEDAGKIYVTYVGGDKEYVFKGDKNDWVRFMNAGSKGRHVQYVLRQFNQAPRSLWS
jgi:hypothetical protein